MSFIGDITLYRCLGSNSMTTKMYISVNKWAQINEFKFWVFLVIQVGKIVWYYTGLSFVKDFSKTAAACIFKAPVLLIIFNTCTLCQPMVEGFFQSYVKYCWLDYCFKLFSGSNYFLYCRNYVLTHRPIGQCLFL